MAKNLVIVESPAKAGTIKKYLGNDYEVVASMGHIRDLPASKLGVDVNDHFVPTYVIPPKARKTLKTLKTAVKGKQTIFLATDLDREGEAIAWHIIQALDLEKEKMAIKRITFDEITQTALTHAVANPTSLNLQLVDAQQARRVLDRLVGYTLSPILWKKIYKGLSAGRVQSVALRLIVERERERQAFVPVEYWSLTAQLSAEDSVEIFQAQLVEFNKQKIEQLTLKNQAEVEAIIQAVKEATYKVSKLESKRVKRRPSAPYTTSTLQQDAVNKLGFSSKRTMQMAQKLYEAGLITYMRTDSVALASSAQERLREYINQEFGSEFLPSRANFYQSKAKNAQEAHEAIRPTDPGRTQIEGEPATQKLYRLIWQRTVASQMKEAELEQTAVTIQADKGLFRATGQRIIFPGFLEVWGKDSREENFLPALTEGQRLNLRELNPEQHFTEPPPRYSEATLIKTLEELGIGRPSTYAPTMDTLIQRRYVLQEQRRFVPEEVGYLVTDLLVKHFPEIIDSHFTADMEEKLDLIASGEENYQHILSEFWQPFHHQVEENTEKIEKIDTTQATDSICPNCQAPMVIKMGRFGKFLACSRFPDCKTTQPVTAIQPTGLICPICSKDLVEKRAKRGVFFGCSGYPTCTFAIWKKEALPAKIEALEKEKVELPYKKEALEAFGKI